MERDHEYNRIIISCHALRGGNCLILIENPELEIWGRQKLPWVASFHFLWVCILRCNSLTGSLLSFGGIRWKRVCVLRDNTGQVQGLLIEFLLTFHIHSESQPEQGLLIATSVPPLHPLPPLLTALLSLQSCFPIQTVALIRNWCGSTTGERQTCGLWEYFEIGFASAHARNFKWNLPEPRPSYVVLMDTTWGLTLDQRIQNVTLNCQVL